MKFNYKFSNLLGSVYKKGDLLFMPDGNTLITTAGNRINIFDLKNNKSSTLSVESKFNYVTLDLCPNGYTLIAINEEGEAHMISLISQTITNKYRFKGKCKQIKFSPNGKYFAVCKGNNVYIFKSPGPSSGQYCGFILERVFHSAFDETTCLDWSFDSKLLAVGSRDMTIKLYPLHKNDKLKIYTLGSHTDSIVGCFFEKDNYDLITISRNGQTCIWKCTIEPKNETEDDTEQIVPIKRIKMTDEIVEDEIDVTKSLERIEEDTIEAISKVKITDDNDKKEKFFYKRLNRHNLADEIKKNNRKVILTAAAYHKLTKILIIGFSTGDFFIYDASDVTQIHSLNISNQSISSITFNNTGDWIALGCSGIGQLLVWEWQSETYVMKQQSHSNNMTCVSYSGDGQYLATSGEDGKIKLWNMTSGFCFITFTEHTAAVTAINFCINKKFIVSSSLDGTVRAFDIIRYRNFKTFTSPKPVQFSCVAVDVNGDFVAAGCQDNFDIYLWSIQNGKLLEVLSGHEGPVASLSFSNGISNTVMASVSWDKTLRIWDAIQKGSIHETIHLVSDGLFVTFNPSGDEVAVATLDGQITIFNTKTSLQVSCIDGKNDLHAGRSDTDLITAKKSAEAKSFTTLCYSADGQFILAGGQSKNVCIYNVKYGLLLRKFEISQNRSLDAVDDFINRRKLTEFGNLALVEERETLEGGSVNIKLPGVRRGDMSARSDKPEVRVYSLEFSPTGQQWAAVTTEGLLIYSLIQGLIFDPWNLSWNVTPNAARHELKKGNYSVALIMAIKLNETNLLQEILESIPLKNIDLILPNLEGMESRLLNIIANGFQNSSHIEFYLYWMQRILTLHGEKLGGQKYMPILLNTEKSLIEKYGQLSKICDYNKYALQCLLKHGEHIKNEQEDDEDNISTDDEFMQSDIEYEMTLK